MLIFLVECTFCMTKIYVGNLSFSATEAEIRALFSQHGDRRIAKIAAPLVSVGLTSHQ